MSSNVVSNNINNKVGIVLVNKRERESLSVTLFTSTFSNIKIIKMSTDD